MQDWKFKQRDDLAWYNCADVDATLQIFLALYPALKSQGLLDLYLYEVVPTAKICKLLSLTGIKRDPKRIEKVRSEVLAEIAEIEARLPDEL